MDSELIPSALDMDVSTWPGYLLYVSGLPFWFDAVCGEVRRARRWEGLYLENACGAFVL